MRFHRGSGVLAAVVAMAVLLVPAAHAGEPGVQRDVAYATDGTHDAAAVCVGVSQSNPGSTTQTIVSTGTAVAPGTLAVAYGCAIVQNGRVVGGVQSALPGSVALTGGTVTTPDAPWSICAWVHAWFVDGTELARYNCPAH
jgi:hypothetical protein